MFYHVAIKAGLYRKTVQVCITVMFAVIYLTKRSNLKVFCQKHAIGIANSEDPDQTAPLGAVCSGSALFAQTNLSENLGT